MTFLRSYQFSEDFIEKLNNDKQDLLKEHNKLISDLNQINSQIKINGYDEQLITAYRQALAVLLQSIERNNTFLICAMLAEQNYKNQLLERDILIAEIRDLESKKLANQAILARPFIPKTFFKFYAKLMSEYLDIVINHPVHYDEDGLWSGRARVSQDLKPHFNKIAGCFVFLELMLFLIIPMATFILGMAFPVLGFILPPLIGIVLIALVFMAVALSINKHMKATNAANLSQHQQERNTAETEILGLEQLIPQKNAKKNKIAQEADQILVDLNTLAVEHQDAGEKMSSNSCIANPSPTVSGLLSQGVFATSATSATSAATTETLSAADASLLKPS